MESSKKKDRLSWFIAFIVFVCGLLILEIFLGSFVYSKDENLIFRDCLKTPSKVKNRLPMKEKSGKFSWWPNRTKFTRPIIMITNGHKSGIPAQDENYRTTQKIHVVRDSQWHFLYSQERLCLANLVQDFINSHRVSVPIFRPCRSIGSI